MLQFLKPKILQEKVFRKSLFNIIELSKIDEDLNIAAANAISLLNYVNIPLSGCDF